jgi:hypothetical protein
MSVATLAKSKVASRPNAVVDSLRSFAGRRGRDASKWVTLDRIARQRGVKESSLAKDLKTALASESVEVRKSDTGRVSARLSPFTASMFGLHAKAPSCLRVVEIDDVPPLVRTIGREPGIMVLVEPLADQINREVDSLWSDLESLALDGWVETWADGPLGPVVCLSPDSADRLGLSPSSDGESWLAPADHDEVPFDQRSATAGDDLEDDVWGSMADPNAPEGWEAAAWSEASESDYVRLSAADLDDVKTAKQTRFDPANASDLAFRESIAENPDYRVPRPNVILHSGKQWPRMVTHHGRLVPWRSGLTCPDCKGLPLRSSHYCLTCDRSGVDALIALLPKD